MKGDGSTELRVAGRFEHGASWIAYPEETMQRASHVLTVDGTSWIVDPVDADDLDEFLGEVPEPAGVVVLLDRHKRDSAAIANRHDVPVYVPESMDGVADELDASTERFGGELADTGYRTIDVVNNRAWQEVALWNSDLRTLVVPESVGTASYFTTSGERLGVHPMLRTLPPKRAFESISPENVLVGHGDPVLGDAAPALADALSNARRRTPRLYAGTLKSLIFG